MPENLAGQVTPSSIDDFISSTPAYTMSDGFHQMRDPVDEDALQSEEMPRVPTNDAPRSGTGAERINSNVKRLIQGIQRLRHRGIEDFFIPLPKIVVVGDQSTGKSSLIEGLSGIKVPRAEGTCTRCPLEINLIEDPQEGARWKCEVYLHTKYKLEGLPKNGKFAKPTEKNPLGPWRPRDPYENHFYTTHDKDEVADILSWAQIVTLNPTTAHERYNPILEQRSNQSKSILVEFSPNVIRLDISGPNLPNLAFYDLPGVIAVPEKEKDEYLVLLVRNLVREYVKAECCINLLVLPMNADAANSNAASIIKEERAQSRTIGVITKPDCVRYETTASLKQLTDVLSGEKYRVAYTHFVVKNNPDPSVDHITARFQETQFFEECEPWATSLAVYKPKFGTPQLQDALSAKLIAEIKKWLPPNHVKIKAKLEIVNEELEALPKPPAGDLPREIRDQIFEFAHEVQKHIDGGVPGFPFHTIWYSKLMEFHKHLEDSRPVLVLPTLPALPGNTADSTPTRMGNRTATISIDSGDEYPDTPTPTPATPVKKHSIASSVQSTPSHPNKRVKLSEIPQFREDRNENKDKMSTSRRFTLPLIRKLIAEGYTSLPGLVDPHITERMISQSTAHWGKLATRFVDETKKMCEKMVKERVEEKFGPRRQTQLYGKVLHICRSFLYQAFEEQEEAIENALRLEQYKPVMTNEKALGQAREKALEELSKACRGNRAEQFLREQEKSTGKFTTGTARNDKLAKITDVQLGPDPYMKEVAAMGDVRAYYECAFSRFADIVGQSIMGELFVKYRTSLRQYLIQELGIDREDADERCAILLAVDPTVEERRSQLKKEQHILLESQTWLESVLDEMEPEEEEEIEYSDSD